VAEVLNKYFVSTLTITGLTEFTVLFPVPVVSLTLIFVIGFPISLLLQL